MFRSIRKKLREKLNNTFKTKHVVLPSQEKTTDQINLNIGGINLSVKHETTSEIPSELSVILPRVEVRNKSSFTPTTQSYSTEIILNSITIVLAPRPRE